MCMPTCLLGDWSRFCRPIAAADIWAATTVRLSHSAKVRVCVRFLQEQLASGAFALKQ